ncbi:MAG: SGNH/GDSL hydrolase family protein [Phycisphaerae bacterium]|nr:SGNH/GDSL hydrolase family protein [Phycisphaerae bacterium]
MMKRGIWGLACAACAVFLPTGSARAGEPVSFLPAKPFWADTTMSGEGLFFVQTKPDERPRAPLLFKAFKIPRVVQPSTGTVMEPGRDYALEPGGEALVLPEGSRIPFMKREDLYPKPGAAKSIKQHRNGKSYLFFGEGHMFHDLQVEVTYTHSGKEWSERGGYVPAAASEQLPKTMDKLRHGRPLALALLGDSISAGGNASKCIGAKPHMPAYGELVGEALEARYGSKVTFKNFSVGGKASGWGVSVIDKVAAEKPDLVMLAFGMNDASGRLGPEKYAANMKRQVEAVRRVNPDAEFILVATMTGNPEWCHTSMQHYVDYRDELKRMIGPGVAVADLTSLWTDLLKRKRFHDLTGNGVNHPNDFGHRLYAQVILALLQ